MTPEEYDRRLKQVISDLEGGAHGDIMMRVANTALTLIKRRVQESGLNPEGTSYPDYTKEYKEFKRKAGKYKGFVDFSFTTRMWSNIKLISRQAELNMGEAVIKATTTQDQEKLNKNTARKGVILDVSKEERDLLQELYDKELADLFHNRGL